MILENGIERIVDLYTFVRWHESLAKNSTGLKIALIPLAEEWLLNFAITRSRENEWDFCDGYLRLNKEGNFQYFVNGDFDTIGIGEPIEYVHQLQNLHFILTHKELTFSQSGSHR